TMNGWQMVIRAHASDSCHLRDSRAGSVKVVFACTFTRQFSGCGCPGDTDGLDGFCPARQSRQREHGHRFPQPDPETACMSMAARDGMPFAPGTGLPGRTERPDTEADARASGDQHSTARVSPLDSMYLD